MTQNFSNLVNLQQAIDVKIKLERLEFSAIENLSNGLVKVYSGEGQLESRRRIYSGVYNIYDIRDKIMAPLLEQTKLKFSIKKNELKGKILLVSGSCVIKFNFRSNKMEK